ALTIRGPDSAPGLSINAQGGSRLFDITATAGDVTLENLSLLGGRTSGDNASASDTTFSGGAIRFLSAGTLTLRGCTIPNNGTAGALANGGGIFAAAGAVTLVNSTVFGNFTGNPAGPSHPVAHGGGLFVDTGALTISNSTVTANVCLGFGGAGGGFYAGTGAV